MGKHDSKIIKNVLKNDLKVLLISTDPYMFSHDSLFNVSENVEV
jgi:hypothetical protein